MGCVTSKEDVNELHPNIFHVTNVDDMGQLISPGQLEITDTELVLYQRGNPPTRWPLCYLRKYGFDSEIFSFECGRRCPTGEGIYAFRCKKAEQLFNLLQQNIQVGNLTDNNDYPVPLTSNGPPVQRRVLPQLDGYLNPNNASVRSHRPDSITSSSNGPASPVSLNSPPPQVGSNDFPTLEHNNNKRTLTEHPYTNSNVIEESLACSTPTYINLNATVSENYVNIPNVTQQDLDVGHLYMNINTDGASEDNNATIMEDQKHCYANINRHELDSIRPSLSVTPSLDLSSLSATSIPNTPTVREVNYVELDLVPVANHCGASVATEHASLLSTTSIVDNTKKSYVTIDFNKTNALSQTVNQQMDVEEGSRKTRHNSTIGELTIGRQSSSLSD